MLSVILMILFVLLDLGLAVCRYNMLCAATQNVARAAVVRGADAPTALGNWGPQSYIGTAADSSPMATTVAAWLATMDPAAVNIVVSWPDGANQPDDRVSVQLSYSHQFLVSHLGLGGSLPLQAQTTMLIAH